MRRITRSQRSIDRAFVSPHSLRTRIHPPPRRTAPTSPYSLPTTTAYFSTSSSHGSLVSRDRKAYNASIRRWQKRLTGDSEPIGAHVDPYDPTSPVRIAPEELGREEETLEDDENGANDDYQEAITAEGLQWVGTKEHARQTKEQEMRDLYWNMTGREYGRWFSGPFQSTMIPELLEIEMPIRDKSTLRSLFHMAAVEVYAFAFLGKDLDVTKFAHKGDYAPPEWIESAKLVVNEEGQVRVGSGTQALELYYWIKNALPAAEIEEADQGDESEAVLEHAEEVVEEEDPEGEVLKSKVEQVLKSAEDTFDFTTNRSEPQSTLAEEKTTKKQLKTEPKPEIATQQSAHPPPQISVQELIQNSTDALNAIQEEISEISDSVGSLHTPLQEQDSAPTNALEATQKEVSDSVESLYTPLQEQDYISMYSEIPLNNPAILFALSKRLTFLTGHRLSDPLLNQLHTLLDLQVNLLSAAKPRPNKLISEIKSGMTQKGEEKAFMKELLELPNVKVQGKKRTMKMEEQEVGRWKVIEYALRERGLPVTKNDIRKEWRALKDA
ncbi:hypothetical protein EJ04DRAFT_577940 [Polyplosphaeria fusca]|uniref:Large ribosomal subunit protein mL50 n=1 Tax=Polyplosphaeria fusca TaxID=682080 RepID=A0A9P4QSL6_9PLEO|nr:hypothetical protein EJ04DRAFT_577940 [Polyplosphaeria fusca]